MRLRPLVALAVLAVTSTSSLPAFAETSDPEAMLWQESEKARRWYYTWTVFFGITTVAQVGLARESTDHDDRVKYTVGAVMSGLGMLSTVAVPPPEGFAHLRLRSMPTSTEAERAARRAEARRMLEEARDVQRLGRSGLAHGVNFAVNLGQGLVIWQGYGNFKNGLFAFVSGTAVGELKIWTQPTGLMEIQIAPTAGGAMLSGRF
jgi:hypothetical protein